MKPIKVQIFRLSTVPMKINQIPISFFKPRVSFPLNIASLFSVMTLWNFLPETLYDESSHNFSCHF